MGKAAVAMTVLPCIGIYCSMAIHYQNNLKKRTFDSYYFQKSLGSFIVNQGFTLGHIPLTPRNVNIGLEILSAFALIIAYFIWNATAKTLQLTKLPYRISMKIFSFFVVWSVLATRFWGEYAPTSPQSDPWLFTWGRGGQLKTTIKGY